MLVNSIAGAPALFRHREGPVCKDGSVTHGLRAVQPRFPATFLVTFLLTFLLTALCAVLRCFFVSSVRRPAPTSAL